MIGKKIYKNGSAKSHLMVTDSKPIKPSLEFRWKYIEQALFFNIHFLVCILVGIFGVLFAPTTTHYPWINQNTSFVNAFMLGIGLSGVICWCFTYKVKGEISSLTWFLCHILLNICHIFCVLVFLFFFVAVGVKVDGSISALAGGVFSALIAGIMLSMKYAYKN